MVGISHIRGFVAVVSRGRPHQIAVWCFGW